MQVLVKAGKLMKGNELETAFGAQKQITIDGGWLENVNVKQTKKENLMEKIKNLFALHRQKIFIGLGVVAVAVVGFIIYKKGKGNAKKR